jgi:subtilisin-like proprotein convertase family protein
MRARSLIWGLLCLLCVAGAWFLWHQKIGRDGLPSRPHQAVAPAVRPTPPSSVATGHSVNTNAAQISLADWNTNKFAGRLSNTTKTIGQLVHDHHAILLANALMDTAEPLNFVFPKNLQPQGDPGAYIVQANGPVDNAFRALLAQAGATIVSYIPNDAYLVRASASVAGMLEASPLTQAVVPYEPYYKIQSPLLPQAVEQMQLPDNTILNLGLFADDAPATVQQIEKLGGQVVGQDQSPFGPIVRVQLPPLLAANWTTLATLSGVQIVEPYHKRVPANDLSRATVGVAANSLTNANYLNLTGTNIIVEVNDTGIDANHPDLLVGGFYNRALGVIGDAPQSLVDTNGHGTHVAGIIGGDGAESTTVTNAPGSTLTNTVGGVMRGGPGQFRGMAPGVTLYSVGGISGGSDTNIISDQYFQEVPALTNALISNNSWVNEGDNAYDLAAASYDAAVRDALPYVTGSQPVLFVFAAGNAGNGNDNEDLGGGIADSIESPATAKDVITVGALQEFRNITNTVTNAEGMVSAPWQPETSTSYRVAGFSSRGNVGIGTEGTFGRYKPDVAAPGTFIVSTRSEQWDIGTYFYQDPTNNLIHLYSSLTVQPGSIFRSTFPSVPNNAVQATITTFPTAQSPFLFAVLPILVGLIPSAPGYDFFTTSGAVSIPPDGGAGYLQRIINTEGFLGGFYYAVSNNTTIPVTFDLFTDVITTNGTGNELLVLSNLDQSIGNINVASTGPGPYYRYETGTSMSAADVSGELALMQQFYANAYGALPSPAMLKAMLINGAQATGFYDFQVQNPLNYEGWGLINLPASLPPGITNQLGVPCTAYLQDQNPANALATGDSQTFYVSVTNAQPLRVTLAWTDPPGDPAAAIKLVNNLVLVVTNYSNPTNIIVYYGNDIGSDSTFNSARSTNTPPIFDSINNIENVYLPPGAGAYSVTVMGYRVNVNAVTAQSNNVVQDYALVISAGNGQTTNDVMTVSATPAASPTPPPVVSNPTGDQKITYVSQNNAVLLNQFVGANTPLLGTNTILFSTNAPEDFGPNNWQVAVGMTNQWHFYVVTNTTGFSNAAFVTFIPDTLSIPRMGVFAGTVANATTPEADIDLYVSTSPGLTNLDPTVIANCVNGTQVGAPPGPSFNGAALSRGGTEFVADTNSQSRTPNVYYVGVKSETQMASEYGFISIFTQTPFSQMVNGNQIVNGVPVPVYIPDGSPALPGNGYVFGLALYPMPVGQVTVSNEIWHQNFGDLIGTVTLNGSHPDVLNNHDSLGNPPGPYYLTYNDSAGGGIPGSRPSDGPGSLNGFIGQQGLGVWLLTEVDDSLTQTGIVYSYTLTIQPHQSGNQGIAIFSVPPHGWAYDFVDVPLGATNLTVYATNLTIPAGPLELFVKFGAQPTLTDPNEFGPVPFGGAPFPNASISVGPPLTSGRYFFGIYNPGNVTQTNVQVQTVILPPNPSAPQTIYSSSGPVPILDDAVTTNNIIVPDNNIISSLEVALRVDHPRVSDLVFHLIGPDGTRELLVENRGGTTTSGMGITLTTSNGIVQPQTFSGGATPPTTNVIDTGQTSGTLNISYNFYTLPDELAVFYPGAATNFFDSGMISGSGVFNIPYTNSPLTIVMNPYGNLGGPGDAWTYTVNTLQTNQYSYLVLTEDTNKTTTPIKFAIPPLGTTNFTIQTNITSGVTNITTNTDLFYLPEQPLDAYDGLSAAGVWTLEIQDDRVGATNPTPMLLSWQLRFNYTTTGMNANGIPPGTTATNVIPPNGWIYYPVNVPTNADIATNILVFATGPLDMWFNSATPPPPGDTQLLSGVTNGSSTLSTFSVPTNIVPGGVYYIGLYNPNPVPVTNGFEVNFHYFTVSSLNPGVPFTNTVAGTLLGDGMVYYSVTVPPNADYATIMLLSSTVPVNVWFNQNKAPVGLAPPDYLLISNATNGVAVLSASTTPPLVPGATYYLGVQNTNGPTATNVLEVNFHLYTSLTNGVPETNSVPTNSFFYFTVTVPTNADYATNLLLFASLPVNVWFNQYGPPTGLYPSDFLLISNATSGASILSASTTPPLVPGATYYLGVQNTNAVAVNFGLEVNFHLVIPAAITGPTITATNINGTNGFLLQWGGPTNYQYTIQWTTNLAAPVPWNTVLNPIINVTYTPTNGHYSWFDDGSLAGGFPPVKFYRVVAGLISPPITNSTPVTNVVVAGSITPLTVTVPANAVAASNVLVSATGPVNVWFSQTTPFTGGTNAGDVLMLSNVTSGSFLLTSSSLPPLVPGANYYLGVQNPGATSVSFVFQVIFGYSSSNNPTTISSVTFTNISGTNGVLLTWYAPSNDLFQVQWTTSLASPIYWNTIPGVLLSPVGLTATNGIFQYFDNGSLTGGFSPLKFYRLIAYPPGAAIPPDLVISSVLAAPGGLQIQWHGSTNYLYDIQWTTNLALPTSSWIVISNLTIPVPLAYTNGVLTYTATNALTAGSAPAEFFRVLLLP